LRAAQVPFSPSNVALLADGGTGQTLLATYQPAIAKMGKKNGRAAAYVCREYACREPISDAESLSEMLSHGRIPETRSS